MQFWMAFASFSVSSLLTKERQFRGNWKLSGRLSQEGRFDFGCLRKRLNPISSLLPHRPGWHEVHCAQRTASPKQVFIVLNGKRLKSPLVQMSAATGFVVSMPAHRVGDGQPTKELTDLFIIRRLHDKVPMIRHGDHRANAKRNNFSCFRYRLYKSTIVFWLFKDL